MPEQLAFRRVTGEPITRDILSYGPDDSARNFLVARSVRFDDDTVLRQHRPVSGPQQREGYERLDNEIHAGRQLYKLADWGYPTQVAELYGDEANSAEPFALLEPYQGRPLSEVAPYMGDDEFDAFLTDLLTGLSWIAAAGIAHQMIGPDTVLWDSGRGALITDFSRSAIFGVPRTELKGYDGWIPKELHSGSCTGMIGPRDDVWAAGRLIFYVRYQGQMPRERGELAELDGLFNGMFNRVLGPVDFRPTAGELLEDGLHRRVNVPGEARRSDRLKAGRESFLEARERKHPGIATPPGFNADLDWMGDPPDHQDQSSNGRHPTTASAPSADGGSAYPPANPDGGPAETRTRAGSSMFRSRRDA